MDNFADEVFYKEKYLRGKQAVITTAFAFYAEKATRLINRHTFNRITDVTDDIKKCCCEIAECLYLCEQQSGKSNGKQSESVGGWSVSYASESEMKNALNAKIKSCLSDWLGDTGLLYRGVNYACKY